MTRDEAIAVLKQSCSNKNLLKHMFATEAVMAGLAERLGEDVASWSMAGLVHDLDYDETANDPGRHGLLSAEKLEALGFPEEIIHAVKAHNEHAPRESRMDRALYASDPVTGLIVAAALMHPTKRLANVDVEFVMRRFREKRFAAGANRDQIETCRDLGLSLEEFLGTAIASMQAVSAELGL